MLQLEYGKPLPESNRRDSGHYPVYGANGEIARSDQKYVDKPGIVVGRKGSAGELTLTESGFWPLDVTYFATFDDAVHDLRFIFYLLQTLELPLLAKGVKPGINRNDVYAIPVRVPALPEQRRIVGILDKAFEGIATARANAERNLANSRALFESELGSVFEAGASEWTPKRLADVALEFGRGRSRHRPRNDPKLYGGRYPFIQTGDVRSADHLITDFSQTYSDAGLAQSKLWPAGTLCITIAANIAETGVLGFDACFPDSVIGVVANPRMTNNRFLEYLLRSVKGQLKAQGKGSAQDNINLGTFEAQTFPFPDLRTQEEIVERLDWLRESSNQVAVLFERKLAALDELKKSLLHHAFSGRL